jgi:hypothetical protein
MNSSLLFLRKRIASLQSLCLKSERPQKFDTTFAAGEFEMRFRTNIIGETIGQPKNSLRWKVLTSVCDNQAA